MPTRLEAQFALTEALAALARAEEAINVALSAIGAEAPAPVTRQGVGVRTTGTQVLAILSSTVHPMTLIDVSDELAHAIVQGEMARRDRNELEHQYQLRKAAQRAED